MTSDVRNYNYTLELVGGPMHFSSGRTVAEGKILQHNGVTVVELTSWVDGRKDVTKGSARRHPGDRSDDRIGALYAYGRALESLGRRLQGRADGLSRHADHVQRQKDEHTPVNSEDRVPVWGFPPEGRCGAPTKSGDLCWNKPGEGSNRCWRHR